jgi:hypothetical protein
VAAGLDGQDAALWAVGGHDAVRAWLRRETGQPQPCAAGTANVLAVCYLVGVLAIIGIAVWKPWQPGRPAAR